jgi:DNA-binding NarL/FixJ family response regulator
MSRPLIRVVIADGFDIVRRGIRGMLEEQGCFRVVGEAADGRGALAVAVETRPHIAMLAASLSEINCIDLTRLIRRKVPETQILVLSNHDDENLIEHTLQSGALGFVLNSDPETHVIAALNALAARERYLSDPVSNILSKRAARLENNVEASVLTLRERQIIQLIAEGRRNREIGSVLCISHKTVECHRSSLMAKLSLQTTADVVRYAIRNNLAHA